MTNVYEWANKQERKQRAKRAALRARQQTRREFGFWAAFDLYSIFALVAICGFAFGVVLSFLLNI